VGHQQGTQRKGEIIPCSWTHNRKGPSLVAYSQLTGLYRIDVYIFRVNIACNGSSVPTN